jgi:Tol biopolymer transport system component
VFASSRDRTLDQTSLWIAPVGPEATPVRLTEGAWIDGHPTWTRDGKAIVFASTRDGGDFDLWRLPMENGRAAGPPEQLTSGPGHEVTPTVSSDGSVLYAVVAQVGEREVASHLEERTPEGTIKVLTDGTTDSAPALSPDETTIAFSRAAVLDTGPSAELWRMGRHGEQPTPIVALPLTDESGPVWSRDGRFVFATSILRGETGVLFSSVIHVDLRAPTPIARMLRDRAGATSRLTPAIAAATLDARALDASPEYLPELARIMGEAVEQQRALNQVEQKPTP